MRARCRSWRGSIWRGPLAETLSGMTVNERLFASGLLDAYDAAKGTGDLLKINAILKQVGLLE